MSYRRFAAAAIAALLLAGCGSTSAGKAPAAPNAAAAKAAPQAKAKSPAPAGATASKSQPAPSAAAPGPKRLRAPKEVTLADNGAIVDLSAGDAFTLRLPAPKGWHWRVKAFSTAVLAESTGAAGTLGVFRAVKAGFTTLTAEEVPPCGSGCPGHATGPLFVVAVRVSP